MTMNRQWAYQPLGIPGQDSWIVYRVKERRDTRGEIASEQRITYPGLYIEPLARALAADLNKYDEDLNGQS